MRWSHTCMRLIWTLKHLKAARIEKKIYRYTYIYAVESWHTRGDAVFVKVLNVFTCRQTDVIMTTKCPFFFLSLLLLLFVSVHSPVPTWGHLSQLRPQALPTVQQHTSWVRGVGRGCSQPLDSDANRKHWARSFGDSVSDRGEVSFGNENHILTWKMTYHSSG